MHQEKKKYRRLVIGFSVLDVLLIAVLAVLVFQLVKRERNPETSETNHAAEKNRIFTEPSTEGSVENSVKRPAENLFEESIQTEETNEKVVESETMSAEAVEPASLEMQSAEIQPLDCVGAVSPVELKSGEDFVTAFSPDGAYSFMYPAGYFYTGNYNVLQQKYFLATADESATLQIYEMPVSVPGNPYESANAMYGILKGEFLEEGLYPYLHQSNGVADDGYSRLIIGGPLAENPSQAVYYCIAFNDTTAYVLKVGCVSDDPNGIRLDYTQTGYLIDCVYRGWSLSGSTYMLRSYEQYLADDMGDKKPDES